MYSHLVLAQGDKNEDGLLEAWELMQMDLRADLAVLSACETARGRFGAGEGMIGLTWALFVAGAPATVVSQWKVESASTRDLMLGFHRQLQSAVGASEHDEGRSLAASGLEVDEESRAPVIRFTGRDSCWWATAGPDLIRAPIRISRKLLPLDRLSIVCTGK